MVFHNSPIGRTKQMFYERPIKKKQSQKPAPNIDPRFLSALKHGLPDCDDVALGIDRLVMLAAKAKNIQSVNMLCMGTIVKS